LDAVLDTAGYEARAAHVFERDAQHLGAVGFGSDDVTGHDDHALDE